MTRHVSMLQCASTQEQMDELREMVNRTADTLQRQSDVHKEVSEEGYVSLSVCLYV